jgi:hypothetical protein
MNFLLAGINTYKIYIGIIFIIWLSSHFMNTYASKYIIKVNFKKFIYDSDNLKINSSAIDTNTSPNVPILIKKVSSPKRNLQEDIIKVAKTIKNTALRAVGIAKEKSPIVIKKVKETASSVVSTVKSKAPGVIKTVKDGASSIVSTAKDIVSSVSKPTPTTTSPIS